MFETSLKLKNVFALDAILFILCIGGLLSIAQRARLPFTLSGKDSLLTINISDDIPNGIQAGDKIISVNGYKITSSEKAEFLTDQKNVGDYVKVSLLTKSGPKETSFRLTNYYSVYYLLSTILVALFFFTIALFVIFKKYELSSAKVFHWASICISLMICFTWANLNTFSFLSKYVFRNILHLVYTLTPALFFHFTLSFPRNYIAKWKRLLFIFYVAGLSLSFLDIYSYISAINVNTDQSIEIYLNLFDLTRIYLIIGVFLSIAFFISAFVREKGDVEKSQLKWVLLGFLIGPFSFVIFWVIPILITGKSLIPEEIITIVQCSVPITFAISIVKYHLLNIDEILNRSIVYSIVISILIIIYSATIGIFVYAFNISDRSIISAVAAIALALFFQPLKSNVQKFVDQKFFRIRYNFRKELSKFSNDIKNLNDTKSLGDYLVREIDKLIPVEKIAFSEFDEQFKLLVIKHHKNFEVIADKTLTIKQETLDQQSFKVAAIKSKVENEVEISTLYQNTLLRWKINLVIPIKSVKGELFGFLLLGNKKSQTKYSIEDIDLLKDICLNAGSTIERIKLQESLIREQMEAERLEELNKQKSTFVSIVSHELKTPLTSIRMFSELLRDNEQGITDKAKDYLKIIEGETDRLTRLINNVLDFSKIERGVKEYTFRQVQLNKIVNNVIEILEYQTKIKGFNLLSNLTEFDDTIYGDADAIIEAVVNLITNSMRFSTDRKEILLNTFPQDNFACVCVKDFGIGIEAKEINKIFDQFYRSENVVTKKIEGTGLGLPIVKHIMDSHKGKISVDSTFGEGSKFTLYFPRYDGGNEYE